MEEGSARAHRLSDSDRWYYLACRRNLPRWLQAFSRKRASIPPHLPSRLGRYNQCIEKEKENACYLWVCVRPPIEQSRSLLHDGAIAEGGASVLQATIPMCSGAIGAEGAAAGEEKRAAAAAETRLEEDMADKSSGERGDAYMKMHRKKKIELVVSAE